LTYQRFYSLYHAEYFTVSSSQYQQSRSKNLTETLKPAVAATVFNVSDAVNWLFFLLAIALTGEATFIRNLGFAGFSGFLGDFWANQHPNAKIERAKIAVFCWRKVP
jgi:hypothetical protein